MQSVVLLFWVVLLSVVSFSGAVREYSNRWTVQIDGDVGEADVLARKHGFVNLGKITENYYSFQHHEPERISRVPSGHLHKGLVSEPNVKTVEQQEMKSYKLLSSLSKFYKPNDLEFGKMWYINRSRDDGPTYNVIDVWKRNITGQGVVVAVIDEGFDPEHPEIEGNYDKRASFDFIDNDEYPVPKNTSVPQYGHGDKCAGVIAAVLNNSNCGVGLAYQAKLGGIRLFFDKKATDDLESRALNHESDYVDIYSNSWGPDDKGFEVTGPGYFTKKALVNGAQHGRNGLGSIYVFAAGNGGLIVKDSCAFNGYVNSIYTIAITGINKDGSIPVYGERCSGIMAVTYSRDIFGSSVVITADADKKCTESFGASSASAAMASGLIALMLSANRKLTWRDVQHIIVWTARTNDIGLISKGAWTTNKAGLKVHDYAGFGLMDASKMVDAALDWTSVPEKFNCIIKGPVLNLKITRKGAQAIIDLKSNCRNEINYLEHVEVHVNLTYSRRGDLEIKLKSPQGTLSKLSHYRHSDSFFKFKDLDWVLMTLHFWGENPEGKWTLLLENSQPSRNNEGILFSWELTLHGTYSDPLAHNPHVSRPGSVHRTRDATPTQKPSRKPSDSSTVPADRIITTDRIIPTVAADKFPSPTMKSDKALIRLVVGIVFAVVVTVIIVIYVGYRHFSR